MNGIYILKGKKCIPAPDTLKWGRWMQKKDERLLKQEHIGKFYISTVFLGLDYDLGMRPVPVDNPLIYETMIFDEGDGKSDLDQYQERYRDYDEALAGHKRIKKMIKDFLKSKK